MSARARKAVVGIDGSRASIDALEWAVRDAEAGDTALYAVMSWRAEPSMYVAPGANNDWVPMTSTEYEDACQRAVDEIINAHVPPGLKAQTSAVVREGAAARVLVNEATELDADVLVVGSRGLGAMSGLMLGSVSDYCIRNAPCPVVVVRQKK